MATKPSFWGRPFNVGDPNYQIVAGPGQWDLIIEALAKGALVKFTFKDRHNSEFLLTVCVTGMFPEAEERQRRKHWFVQVMDEDGDEFVLYYLPRPDKPKQSRGHITCLKPWTATCR